MNKNMMIQIKIESYLIMKKNRIQINSSKKKS